MNMRKLIRFGKNSYVLSLPKPWVEKNKLQKGDLISIEEAKDGLFLKTNSTETLKEEPKSIVIEAENKSPDILRTEIVSAYLNNYNMIEVISKDLKNKAPEIKSMLQNLSGLEIINQSSTRIVAKDLIDIKEIPIKTLIRRMDNIARAMLEDTFNCFCGKEDAESIIHRDEDVNRLHFLTSRIIRGALKDVRIANSLQTNSLRLHSDHTVTTMIERIADNTKRICRYIGDTKVSGKWSEEMKTLFNSIKQSYFDVMRSYHTNDEKIALEVEKRNKEIIVACDSFFEKHYHKDLKFTNGDGKGVCNFRPACAATAKIVENMKAMASSVKYIARTVIGGG